MPERKTYPLLGFIYQGIYFNPIGDEFELIKKYQSEGLVRIVSSSDLEKLQRKVKNINEELQGLEKDYNFHRDRYNATSQQASQLSKLNKKWLHRLFSRKKTLEEETRRISELNQSLPIIMNVLRSICESAIAIKKPILDEGFRLNVYENCRGHDYFPFTLSRLPPFSRTSMGHITLSREGGALVYPLEYRDTQPKPSHDDESYDEPYDSTRFH